MSSSRPREVEAVEAILRSQGATSWEPRVVAQLLEFSYRHTGTVLHEAQHYAAHRTREPPGSAPLTVDDVRLAAQCSSTHTFTEPLGGDELARMAQLLNKTPLPPVPRRQGLVYPAEVALLAPAFQVLPPSKTLAQIPYDGAVAGEDMETVEGGEPQFGEVRRQMLLQPLKRSRVDALAGPSDDDAR